MQKRKIILSGELGKKFGKVHEFVVSTPAEAVRALCANFKEFESWLIRSSEAGVGYKLIIDKEKITDADRIKDPFSQTFRIVPVISGAKSGIGGIILGAVIIATAFATGGMSLAASGIVYSGIGWQIAGSIAFSMVMGGISQILSPQPKASSPQEAPENLPSYAFNGPVNTTAQGQCVPVGYGRLIVGSAVISAGVTSDEYGGTALS